MKVCDVGIAAIVMGPSGRTQTQAFTLAYASPEELDGDTEVGSPADVYSFATTWVHLMTGRAAAASPTAGAQTATDDEEQHSGGGGIAAIAALIAFVLWVLALPGVLVVRASISRRREQLADASAVQFTRDPYGLRRALEKIAGSSVGPSNVRMSNASLWIANPYIRPSAMPTVSRLLDTHPPIERRIEWLRSLEGANTLWHDL